MRIASVLQRILGLFGSGQLTLFTDQRLSTANGMLVSLGTGHLAGGDEGGGDLIGFVSRGELRDGARCSTAVGELEEDRRGRAGSSEGCDRRVGRRERRGASESQEGREDEESGSDELHLEAGEGKEWQRRVSMMQGEKGGGWMDGDSHCL